ncbi:hypothetical protein GCM10009594_22480 [Kocuria palustris]|uniref:acyltransferase n=1 Tax=Kocuria TaxID=57493 RepID=UPI00045EBC11|nr:MULTISPECIES: DapH/DapD/GlmU-related protein [Kocuria]MBM7824143.1 acetyltransferase-like isoleucine patch superfamily enzyme [Kocuria palustris]MCY1683405.1 DapH/DapD/GlmU-related protein [Kocuria sp. SL71]
MRIPGLAALRRAAWEAALTPIVPNTRRRDLLQRLGLAGVADGVLISDGVVLAPPRRISIGEGSFLNRQVFVDTEVHLGRHVFVGPRAMFVTTRHPVGGPQQRAAPGHPDPVHVGDGSWIGAGAIILPGVTIGSGCVIGAGAVVTKDCAADGVYAGVPARRIRELPDDSPEVSE